jgi:hypothetical protein
MILDDLIRSKERVQFLEMKVEELTISNFKLE